MFTAHVTLSVCVSQQLKWPISLFDVSPSWFVLTYVLACHEQADVTMLSKKLLFVALLAVYVSYEVYDVPVPKEVSEPHKLRLVLTIQKFQLRTLKFLHFVNVIVDYKALRWLILASAKPPEGVLKYDTQFDGVPVRVYKSKDSSGDGRAMVYYHGGGWVLFSVDTYDSVAAYFAQEANLLVVSVEYRLVPEHSKKDGLEDCFRATKYFLRNAGQYGVDPERVVIAGDSAGGNLAAAVALRIRDESFSPMPRLQLLIYPCVQAIDLELPSYQQNADGPLLTKYLMAWFFSYTCCGSNRFTSYFLSHTHVPDDVRKSMAEGVLNHDLLPNENKYPPYERPDFGRGGSEIWNRIKDDYLDPYSFPLMASNHSRLPDAYILTAQHDVLRDDGYLYAYKLKQDGVKVTHYNCPYCWHGIISSIHALKDASKIMNRLKTFLEENL